jgi:hypothetical protein
VISRVLAIVFGVILAVLIAEVLLRVIVGPPARFLYSHSFTDAQSDFEVVYGTDSQGRRRTCAEKTKVTDPIRVAVLGDSFTFGQGVRDCHDFVSLLNRDLADYEFVNLGSIGAGIESYLLVARDFVDDRFDQVLVVFYGNDVSEVRIDRSLVGRIADRCSLAALVRRAYYRMMSDRQLAQARRGGSDRVKSLDGHLNNILSTLSLDPEYYYAVVVPQTEQVEEFSRKFAELVELLARRVGRENVIVSMVPEGHVVSSPLREFISTHGGRVAAPDDPGPSYRLVEASAAEHGVTFVETFASFREDGDVLYFQRDLHWTEAGQERMAEVLRRVFCSPSR